MRRSDGKPAPLLVGLLIDVSGSMNQSIGSIDRRQRSRLESAIESIERLVHDAANLTKDPKHGRPINIAAYGFGFRSFIGGGVRSLVEDESGRELIGVGELSRNWKKYVERIESAQIWMGGSTPMLEAFTEIRRAASRYARDSDIVIFLLSDGEPDNSRENISSIANDMRSLGATIVSCFVTDQDVVDARRLYASRDRRWSEAAGFMFELASELNSKELSADLVEHGWQFGVGARLFTQINQSEMLTDALNMVLSIGRSRQRSDQAISGKSENGNMLELLAVSQVASILGNAVNIVDKLYSQYMKFRDHGGSSSPANTTIMNDKIGEKINAVRNGNVVQSVSYSDLERTLSPSDLKWIKAKEKALENHYNVWISAYPALSTADDPITRARWKARLDDVASSMGGELADILDFIENTVGIQLEDHYLAIRQVARS